MIDSLQGEIPNLIFLGKIALQALFGAMVVQTYMSKNFPDLVHSASFATLSFLACCYFVWP